MQRFRPNRLSLLLTAFLLVGVTSAAWSHSDSENDGLIDGGGKPETDCVAKFQTGIELNYPAKKPKSLYCTDGDFACDTDGAVNGSCTIDVGVCLADDEEMETCVPAGVGPGGVRLKNGKASSAAYDLGIAGLQANVDTLIGAGLPCDNPGAGGGNCFTCTDEPESIVLPMSQKKGKKTLRMLTKTVPTGPKGKAIKDADRLKVRCVDCETDSALEHIAAVIFEPSCAISSGCHTGAFPAGGLDLDIDSVGADGLYDQLVNQAATSPGAGPLGLARVAPGDANLGTEATGSLIFEKLLRTQSELDELCAAGGQGAGCLGQHMPPGSDSFSQGRLNLLRAWIEGGAPRDGWVPGATCGSPEDVWVPATAPPAPAPGEGFQLHMPRPEGYSLAPGTEFEGCWALEVPETVTEDWYIDRIEIVANSGTHHLVLWEPTTEGVEPGDFDPNDLACISALGFGSPRLVAQDPTFEVSMPENTAFRVSPGDVFGVNPHYQNTNNVDIYPEIWFNFYGSTTPATAEVDFVTGGGPFGFPGDMTFRVEPFSTGRSDLIEWDTWGDDGICMFSVTTHQHRRGTGMKIWTDEPTSWNDDSNLLIHSTDWDHPGWLAPSPPLHLTNGDSLWLQCQWDNGVLTDVTRRCQIGAEGPAPHQCGTFNPFSCTTNADCPVGPTTGLCRDCDLDFGPEAEDEMCFILAYSYDAQDGPEPCPW